MEYRNKRTADAGIPDVLKDLVTTTEEDDLNKKAINCSPIALSFFKVMSTVVEDECFYYYYDYHHINNSSNLKECFNDIQSVVHSFDDYLNKTPGVKMLLSEIHVFLISGRIDTVSWDKYTGCGCDSYWGMTCKYHTKQMFNLLSPGWDGLNNNHRPQGFMVAAKDEIGNTTPSFVVDALRYHEAYKYSKLTDKPIEGPTPEVWMHCLWSTKGDANGYFLFLENTDNLEGKDNSGISDIYSLRIFGGLMQDHYLGIKNQ